MRINRQGSIAALTLVGAMALTACGSDDNTSADPAATTSGAAVECATGTLSGEGSSAQQNAIEEVITSFQDACKGATVNYNATGSGAGIKQFNAGQVDFAGSDSALKTEATDGGTTEAAAAKTRCQGNDAWNLPLVAGPIAVAYNLPGVDGIVLTPDVIAKAFLGTIKTWDDPAIKALNSGATLPSTAIKVFYRSDESGTTENFEKYLAGSAASAFTAKPSKKWAGTVGEGREKSAGVAEGVKATEGGLGYMEWSYATDNSLGVAKVDNGAGAVELSGASAGKALEAAAPAGEGNDLRLKLDYATKAPGTYPIVLVTYEVVCSKGLAADKTALVKAFLTHFGSADVQTSLEKVGYAPLPSSISSKVETAIAAIS